MQARYHTGNYLGSSSITINGVADVPSLEAMACHEAQALAADLLVNRVLIASDCSFVINGIAANSGGAHAAAIKELNDKKNDF